jgi:hypothetical protein
MNIRDETKNRIGKENIADQTGQVVVNVVLAESLGDQMQSDVLWATY